MTAYNLVRLRKLLHPALAEERSGRMMAIHRRSQKSESTLPRRIAAPLRRLYSGL
jgi:hypothetical protein